MSNWRRLHVRLKSDMFSIITLINEALSIKTKMLWLSIMYPNKFSLSFKDTEDRIKRIKRM